MGAAADGAEASLVGEVLDNRYRIIKKLGEGGMGEVYAAEHIHIEKKVAIKLLRPEIVSNQEAVSRFRQEARSASSIGHRNIIGIDDFGQLKDGRIYLCMELLAGAPLNDMIKEQLPPDRLLNILIQTGHGLAAAHAKNIVHRDMKPENIFVTIGANGEDVPKLLDFGIAKVAGQDGQNNLTRTGTIFGTPYYMAPEQALGQGVDARVDVYAMGVIIYEVFAGSLPFQGESFMGILTQHITTEPEPVAQRAAKAGRTLPPGLAEVIARCLAKDPEKRYRSMDELVNALVGVYRSMVGAGMSSYMEAFAPRTGAMPAAGGPGGMMPGPGGHGGPGGQSVGPNAMMPAMGPGPMSNPGMAPPPSSAPTMMAGGPQAGHMTPPGHMGPGPMGPHSGPHGPHSGPHGPHAGPGPMMPGHSPGPGQMMPGPGPMNAPYMGGSPSGGMGAYASDGSQVAMPPRSSKAGLIAVIVILLVVGGGVAAFVLFGGKQKDGDGTGSGSELAAAGDAGGGTADPLLGTDAATAAGGSGDGTGSQAGTGIGTGTGAIEPGVEVDAAAAVEPGPEIDAGTGAVEPGAEVDAGATDVPDVIEPITVLIAVTTRGATIYVDGKKLGKSPQMVKVKPGETRQVKVKAPHHKDDTRTIDGTDDRIEISLKPSGGGGGSGSGTGTGGGGPDKSFCETHPLDPDCAQ